MMIIRLLEAMNALKAAADKAAERKARIELEVALDDILDIRESGPSKKRQQVLDELNALLQSDDASSGDEKKRA